MPSATELIYELETQELLYGVTHECKYPKEAQDKPQMINSVINSEKLSSNEINTQTCQLLNEGKEIFVLNEENLKEANPDLIITKNVQSLCSFYKSNRQSNSCFAKKTHGLLHGSP